MKHFYLSLFLVFVIISANAQVTITNDNTFLQGDNIILRSVFDVDAGFEIGASGEDVVWDFSNQLEEAPNIFYEYIDEAGLPYADQIANIDLAEQLDENPNGYFYFNTLSGTIWERSGWYILDSGTTMWVEYTNTSNVETPLELIQYPFTYNHSFSSNFNGEGQYDMGSGPDDLQIVLGTYDFDCDAWGKLILPHKVYPNALRVHITENFTLQLMMVGTPVISSVIEDDAYYWYVEGVNGPVMSFIASAQDGSTTYNARWHRPDYTEIVSTDFVSNSQTGNTDDIFTFTNLSEPLNQGSTFAWEFSPATVTYVGETDASSAHPQVTFNEAGNYTVSLTITNTNLSPSEGVETKIDYISIEAAPVLVVDFTADIQNVPSGGTVTFENLTIPDATGGTTYFWNLNPAAGWHWDGFTDNTYENPILTFETDGCYAVQLIATNDIFSNSPVTETKLKFFNVGGVADCDVTTAIEMSVEKSVKIYPNPTFDVLNIDSDSPVMLSIIDIAGKQVYLTEKQSTTHVIDVSNLPRGIYFINLIGNKKVITKKVVLR